MIYLVRLKPIIIIYLIFLVSCGKTNYEINSNLIKNTFIDTSQVITQDIKNDLFATMSIDTLRFNQNLTYNQALNILRNIFMQIDSTSENIETKTYLKALYLTEFVYASFSFQFLGSQLGKTNHQIAIQNWDKMPLENCYNMGNTNLVPVWCGDRTSFYIRLLDSLLGIKATSVSIKNVHTFPLVNIGNKRFVFDPYDPFVIFDSLKMRVMDYDEALKYFLNNNSINIIRTKKTFGVSNELVSNDLAKDILAISKNEKQDISQKLIFYFKKNKAVFLKRFNKCTFDLHNKNGKIYLTNLKEDKFILHLSDKLNNLPMNTNRFKKYYYGIDCK
jgi:hypothetical protein